MNLDIRGVDYHLITDGDGTTEPTGVPVHGFSGSSADWAEITPKLRAMGRAVVAVDLAGHGRSQTTDDPARYSMAETVRDLDAIAAHLGLTQADWLGYSMGGRVAPPFAPTPPPPGAPPIPENAPARVRDAG